MVLKCERTPSKDHVLVSECVEQMLVRRNRPNGDAEQRDGGCNHNKTTGCEE